MAVAPILLVLVDLIQDVDVLLPVLIRLRSEPRLRTRVLMSGWLAKDAPRSAGLLTMHGVPFAPIRRRAVVEGAAPRLDGISAVLTASESSAAPHAAGHSLARRARAIGRIAYTLQHGVELPVSGSPDRVRMASDVLFCWSDHAAREAAALGPRPIVVGRPELADMAPPPSFDLGVFENLHWTRYADADRAMFLERLAALLVARPQLKVRVRAHPAGGWLDAASSRLAVDAGVRLESSAESRASAESGRIAVASCARVLTTPSTIALDAVQAGRRTALALPGGPAYRRLPALSDLQDWLAFADGSSAPGAAEADFRAEHVRPGDAAEEIVRRIISDLSRA